MKPSTLIGILVFVLLALVYFSGTIAVFLTDWRWFHAVGYASVFQTTVLARVGLGAVLALVAFAFLQGNAVWALRRTQGQRLHLSDELSNSPIGRWLRRTSGLKLATLGSAIVALLIGLGASAFWRDFLLYMHGAAFGFVDPILHHDASFYVFVLPMLRFARSTLLAVVVLSAIVSAVIYATRGAVKLELVEFKGQVTAQGLEVAPAARKHLAVLLGVWIALMALGSLLQRYFLLYDQSGLISGPGRADVVVAMPLLLIQAVVTFAAAILVLVGVARGTSRLWITGVALLVLAAVASATIPTAYQRLLVLPNELALERPYIEHHIAGTRYAFALDDVMERKLTGEAHLSWNDIEENEPTIKNIRLWDHGPLLDTFSQVQEIRTYYNFPAVDNDRYMVSGELRQTMLSPRELESSSLPARARTWVNETMVYTHGYGVALGPVNQITPEGLPELWIKDLPPQVEFPKDLGIDQPAIYYGESMREEVFVNTDNEEFDYPSGEQNAYTKYAGGGGAPVGNMIWRALWSIRLSNSKVLLTSDINPDSRVMLYREVMDRAQRIAPFLDFDQDPYLVIADGRLVWILDAYTVTSHFPYAQRIAGRNYMRNSVKITVDAYDGSITFYLMDQADPIVQAWASAFPDLFTPVSEMPATIRAHIRSPQDFFSVQAHLFAIYHMTDPQMFYNREDEWEVPVVGGTQMSPYYIIMKIPGEEQEEFILMQPFVPRNKPNLAAWIVARSDGDNYGEMLAYMFPKDKMVYGPTMIMARFNQDDQISEKLSLWNQQGSEVVHGTLLVIPIEESLIYVEPLYLRAESGSIPELKRVLVAYQNQIAMEPTLTDALRVLFGETGLVAEAPATEGEGDEAKPGPETGGTVSGTGDESLAVRAEAHYQRASEAAQRGDWTTFGTELDQLGAALEALVQSQGPGSTPPTEEPAPAEPAPAPVEGSAPAPAGAGGG